MIIAKKQYSSSALWMVLALMTPALSGCSSTPVDLDSREHTALLQQDRQHAEQRMDQGATPQRVSLTLEQAIEHGITHNLDARVAAMEILVSQKNVTLEKLKALPSVTASATYTGRDNDAASSSRSIESGLQSLEPSQSSDRDRKLANLDINWNLLDVALAYTDAKKASEEAKIAAERHEKVIQNIERDVYAAYWRAYAYQETKARTDELIKSAGLQVGKLNQAVNEKILSADQAADQAALLADRARTLRDLDDRLNLSEVELKSMLSLPLNTQLDLKKPSNRADAYKSLLAEPLETHEWEALKGRPELRDEILQKNITLRDTKREVLTTLPGFELFAGWNHDSNSFLEDPSWISSSAKIVQSLISIVTLPTRLEASRNKEALADSRRHALVAAVLAQTTIARARLGSRETIYKDAGSSMSAATKKAGLVAHKSDAGMASKQSALQARIEQQIEIMRHKMAEADLQDSYAGYMNTIGRRFFRPVNLVSDKVQG